MLTKSNILPKNSDLSYFLIIQKYYIYLAVFETLILCEMKYFFQQLIQPTILILHIKIILI